MNEHPYGLIPIDLMHNGTIALSLLELARKKLTDIEKTVSTLGEFCFEKSKMIAEDEIEIDELIEYEYRHSLKLEIAASWPKDKLFKEHVEYASKESIPHAKCMGKIIENLFSYLSEKYGSDFKNLFESSCEQDKSYSEIKDKK